jgi:DNA-binding transcriptional MerR regulator
LSEKSGNKAWSLGQLADETGLSRRTIRYYIARGLLTGPAKSGRNSEYSQQHLERLRTIQRLQNEGRTLAEVAHRLAGEAPEATLPRPVITHSYVVAPEVTVQVQAGVSPWRMKLIREALKDLSARLTGEGEARDENDIR